jgi:hypothetical protein
VPSPNGHRAERDGCGCPPWVRCVHFEGQVLTLRDNVAAKALHDASCISQGFVYPYSVAIGGTLRPAGCCDMDCFWNSQDLIDCPDLPAAEAEFRRREEELRAVDVQ